MKKIKRLLVVGLVVITVGLLAFAIPAFAHDPADESGDTLAQGTWDAMHEACEEGDWQAMTEAAEEVHEDSDYGACHDEYTDSEDSDSGGWGSMMGGHMGNWGNGMMGW